MARGRLDEAIALRQRSIDIRRQLFGGESAAYGIGISRLAQLYARKREFVTADSLFGAALVNQRRYVSETHYDVRAIFALMSERYALEGKRAEADR